MKAVGQVECGNEGRNGLSTGSIRLLNVTEVAEALGCTTRTVRRWAAEGRMPSPLRIGRTVRWRQSDLESWIANGCPNCWGE